jgi:hypothetical protein
MSVQIGTNTHKVEIDFVEVTGPGPREGDLRLVVSAQHADFSGRADAWVTAESWADFLRQLHALERTRRGAAVLEGIDPRELALIMEATDRAGHMSIRGSLGVRGLRELRFDFSAMPFDPSELPQILKRLSAFAANEVNLGESP